MSNHCVFHHMCRLIPNRCTWTCYHHRHHPKPAMFFSLEPIFHTLTWAWFSYLYMKFPSNSGLSHSKTTKHYCHYSQMKLKREAILHYHANKSLADGLGTSITHPTFGLEKPFSAGLDANFVWSSSFLNYDLILILFNYWSIEIKLGILESCV